MEPIRVRMPPPSTVRDPAPLKSPLNVLEAPLVMVAFPKILPDLAVDAVVDKVAFPILRVPEVFPRLPSFEILRVPAVMVVPP